MLVVDFKMCKGYIVSPDSLRVYLSRKVGRAGAQRSQWPDVNQVAGPGGVEEGLKEMTVP